METFSISSRFASGVPICPHADTDTVTLRSLDSVTGTIQLFRNTEAVVWDLAGAVVKLAVVMNQTRWNTCWRRVWGRRVVIVFIFKHTSSPKLIMFLNAVCYCRWLILWSFVKMLKKCLFDNYSSELQTGSFIPVPFISNSMRKEKKKLQKLAWKELQSFSKTVDLQRGCWDSSRVAQTARFIAHFTAGKRRPGLSVYFLGTCCPSRDKTLLSLLLGLCVAHRTVVLIWNSLLQHLPCSKG